MVGSYIDVSNYPDDNGIELYRDRPEAEWPRAADGKGLQMISEPLDLRKLLAEAE
jgi:catechol 2,3-dioxygenase